MPNLSANIENNIRNALIQAIVDQPRATIEELLALVRGESGPLLRAVTLGELADAVKSKRPAKARATGSEPAKRVKVASAAPNTRTAEGRAAYDKAMHDALTALGGGPVASAELIAKVGGTSLQARASLNRLIEAGSVTYAGKARGTRYSLAK